MSSMRQDKTTDIPPRKSAPKAALVLTLTLLSEGGPKSVCGTLSEVLGRSLGAQECCSRRMMWWEYTLQEAQVLA